MLSLCKYVPACFPLMPLLTNLKNGPTLQRHLYFKKMLSPPEYVLALREYPHFVKMYPSPKIKMVLSRCKPETGPMQRARNKERYPVQTHTETNRGGGEAFFKVQKNILILKKKQI